MNKAQKTPKTLNHPPPAIYRRNIPHLTTRRSTRLNTSPLVLKKHHKRSRTRSHPGNGAFASLCSTRRPAANLFPSYCFCVCTRHRTFPMSGGTIRGCLCSILAYGTDEKISHLIQPPDTVACLERTSLVVLAAARGIVLRKPIRDTSSRRSPTAVLPPAVFLPSTAAGA